MIAVQKEMLGSVVVGVCGVVVDVARTGMTMFGSAQGRDGHTWRTEARFTIQGQAWSSCP